VQERYAYQPYGQPLFLDSAFVPQSASSFDWETLFAGYRWTETTDLYLVRNRVLHPLIGTWIQRDPAGYDSYLTLYEYSGSNPPNRTDSSGLKWDCIVCACCAGSAGLTCSALCATSHWDVPGESFGSCFWKCLKSVPGASQTWDLACVTACASCGGRKLPKLIPCSKKRKQQLQAAANLACKGSGPFSCNPTQSCTTLKINFGKATACAAARDAINTICFRGGDQGHRQAAANARRAAAKCKAIAVSKGCP
jgi:RHS repeat-associated protein